MISVWNTIFESVLKDALLPFLCAVQEIRFMKSEIARLHYLNPFLHHVVKHVDTRLFISSVNQKFGFYMLDDIVQKRVNI